MLHELKSIGIRFAMDDFGTGYSSLSYLRRLPIDVLKIDQSFVHDLTGTNTELVMVGAIIAMGKSLQHVVVAEGIETHEQKSYLQSQFCSEGQGYLFSQPLPADELAALLRTGATEIALSVQ